MVSAAPCPASTALAAAPRWDSAGLAGGWARAEALARKAWSRGARGPGLAGRAAPPRFRRGRPRRAWIWAAGPGRVCRARGGPFGSGTAGAALVWGVRKS